MEGGNVTWELFCIQCGCSFPLLLLETSKPSPVNGTLSPVLSIIEKGGARCPSRFAQGRRGTKGTNLRGSHLMT